MVLSGRVGLRSLLGLMLVVHVASNAPCHRSCNCMVMRVVPGNAADNGAPDASLCIDWSDGNQAEGNRQR